MYFLFNIKVKVLFCFSCIKEGGKGNKMPAEKNYGIEEGLKNEFFRIRKKIKQQRKRNKI